MEVKSPKVTEKISMRKKCALCWRLLKEIRHLAPSFIPSTLFRQLLAVGSGYLSIYVSASVLRGLEEHGRADELLTGTLTLLGIIFVMSAVTRWLEKYNNTVKETIFTCMEGRTAVKAMEIDYPDLESPYISDLKRRMADDNDWGSGFWGALQSIEYIVYQLFNLVFALGLLIPVLRDIERAGGALFWLFIGILLLMLVGNAFGESHFKKQVLFWQDDRPENPEDVNLVWGISDIPKSALKDFKLFGARPLLREYFEEHGKEYLKRREKMMSRSEGRSALAYQVLGVGIRGVCYFFITVIAGSGGLAISSVVWYVGCFERLLSAGQSIIRDSLSFLLVARRQCSTLEYLDAESSLYRGTLPLEKRSDDEYEIEFRDVSFRYPGSKEYALKNLSLKFRIGERMAVVGRNGSGKTTMIKLLARLYDPTEGTILLNGIDIRKFDYHEYQKLFSIVFQDFSLFALSIAQNVACSEKYDAARVEECLARAGFGERLAELPNGIRTLVGREVDDSGVEMSGGERQKIAIARAFYKDSPFILLDEPTAALDPIAEFEVYSAFNEMVGSKTAVYISHRLSSCRFCDDIVVFDRGRIAQRGRHEELMEVKDGIYHSLWTAQAQYYEHPTEAAT